MPLNETFYTVIGSINIFKYNLYFIFFFPSSQDFLEVPDQFLSSALFVPEYKALNQAPQGSKTTFSSNPYVIVLAPQYQTF